MKIVLTYTELRALLAPVIPHACNDDMLPVLCRVPIAVSGEYLVAQATNRFSAAFQRVKPAAKPPKTFAVQLLATDAKRMLNLLRPNRGSNPDITLDVDKDGSVRVAVADAGLALGFTGIDLAFASALVDGGQKFPDLSALLPADFDTAVPEISVNPDLLNSFKAATDQVRREHGDQAASVSMHMPKQHNKPIVITIGDDFLGVLMPRLAHDRRPGDQTGHVAEKVATWRGRIPVAGVKQPAKAKAAS